MRGLKFTVAALSFSIAAWTAWTFDRERRTSPGSDETALGNRAPKHSSSQRPTAERALQGRAAIEALTATNAPLQNRRLRLPDLDPLERAAVESADAAELRAVLVQTLDRLVFADPICFDRTHAGWSKMRFRVTVEISDNGSARVTRVEGPVVQEGAPVAEEALNCARSRVHPPVVVSTPGRFQPGRFEDVRVDLEFTPRRTPSVR